MVSAHLIRVTCVRTTIILSVGKVNVRGILAHNKPVAHVRVLLVWME